MKRSTPISICSKRRSRPNLRSRARRAIRIRREVTIQRTTRRNRREAIIGRIASRGILARNKDIRTIIKGEIERERKRLERIRK